MLLGLTPGLCRGTGRARGPFFLSGGAWGAICFSELQRLERGEVCVGMGVGRHSCSLVLALSLAGAVVVGVAPPALALTCAESCVPDPQPPPEPSADATLPSDQPTTQVSGTVRNLRGVPITGAKVYSAWTSALTSSSGAYTVTVPANTAVTLTAKHDLYAWKSINVTNPSSLVPVDFNLAYLLNTEVSPSAFNTSPKTLTVSTYSTVPQVGTKVLVQTDTGEIIELSFDTSYFNPKGWSRWTGTWSVPGGIVEGRYPYYSCVLDGIASGRCYNPSSSGLLSQVKSEYYIFDRRPPMFSAHSIVPDHNVLAVRPTIGIRITDDLSGVSTSTPILEVDGKTVAASFDVGSGMLSYTPTTGLMLGVHAVSHRASDLAGNLASGSWKFNVASLTPSPASARVIPVRKPIGWTTGPAPTSVTVTDVVAELDGYDLSVSGVPLSGGKGSVARAAGFSALRATFENELGQSVTVATPSASVSFGASVVALEAQSAQLGLHLDVARATLPALLIPVPTGFQVTAGSTVAIDGDPVEAESEMTAPTHDLLPEAIGCSLALPCVVTGTVVCTVKGDQAVSQGSCTGSYPRAYLNRSSGPQDAVFALLDTVNGTLGYSSTRNKYPDPNPAATQANPDGSISWPNCGAPTYRCENTLMQTNIRAALTPTWTTGSLFEAHGRHYFFTIFSGTSPTWMGVWQSTDATPRSLGCLRPHIEQFGHSVKGQGGWQVSDPAHFTATIGTPSSQFDSQQISLASLTRQDSGGGLIYAVGSPPLDLADARTGTTVLDSSKFLRGTYDGHLGKTIDPVTGELVDSSNGSRNLWLPLQEAQGSHVEVMTGTEFRGSGGYDFATVMQFKFKIDGC